MKFLTCCIILLSIAFCSCTRPSFYSVDSLVVEEENAGVEDTINGQIAISNYSSIENILCTDDYLIVVQHSKIPFSRL